MVCGRREGLKVELQLYMYTDEMYIVHVYVGWAGYVDTIIIMYKHVHVYMHVPRHSK